jgi:hypothetical protein
MRVSNELVNPICQLLFEFVGWMRVSNLEIMEDSC